MLATRSLGDMYLRVGRRETPVEHEPHKGSQRQSEWLGWLSVCIVTFASATHSTCSTHHMPSRHIPRCHQTPQSSTHVAPKPPSVRQASKLTFLARACTQPPRQTSLTRGRGAGCGARTFPSQAVLAATATHGAQSLQLRALVGQPRDEHFLLDVGRCVLGPVRPHQHGELTSEDMMHHGDPPRRDVASSSS